MRPRSGSGRCAACVPACLALAAHAEDDCEYADEHCAELPLYGIKLVVIDAGGGRSRVLGKPAQKTLTANGFVCAPSKSLLQEAEFDVRRSGDRHRDRRRTHGYLAAHPMAARRTCGLG